MLLKTLEVFGFKSFADRTRFEFGPGITGIVGPNGCGKSNVVDALRWVMGEQSAKSLRGEEMGDVIFGGTARRKAAGYCEVVMVFDNKDRRLPIDQDEVSVARRLYRTGDSEYYINKELCRLRDVRDLLMDSGLGTSAYCFIAQGQIEKFLSSDPKDRRLVFEEAAGISKYRSRKALALRKLERVETNLQTLASLRSEADAKLRSLTRQAQKARRYQRLQELLNAKLVQCALGEYRELKAAKAALDTELATLRDQEAAAAARVAEAEARVSQAELEDVELERAASEADARRMEVHAATSRLEGDIQRAEEQAQDLESRSEALRAEAEALRAQIEERSRARAAAEQALAELESRLAEARAAAEAAARDAEAAARREAEIAAAVADRQSRAMETVRARAEAQNGLAAAEADLRNLSARAERLEAELARIDEAYRDTHARAEETSGNCVMLADRIGVANRTVSEAREEIAVLERQAAGLEEMLARQRAEIESRRARLVFLRELEDRREGVSSGAKAVLKASREEGVKFGVVHGLVAELLEASPEYESAIETALGGRASDVVVDTAKTAANAIDFLKLGRAGRASFLPLDRMRPTAPIPAELARREGAVGRACDLLKFDPQFRTVFEYLLGRVLIVRDRDAAIRLAQEAGAGTRMVTLDGEIVDGNGPVTGGLSATAIPGLLSRKTEIKQLQAALFEAEQMLVALSADRRKVEERKEAARARAESANGQARQLEKVLAATNAELASLRREEKNLEQRRLAAAVEFDEASRDRDATASRIRELSERVSKLAEDEHALRTETEKLSEELARAKAERESREKAHADTRTQVAGLEEKHEGLSRDRDSLARELREREQELQKRLAEADEMGSAAGERRAAAESKRHELHEKSAELERLAAEAMAARARRDALRGEIEAIRNSSRSCREELLRVKGALSDLRVKENELLVKLQTLEERTKNELGVSLEERLASPEQAPPDVGTPVDSAVEEPEAEEEVQQADSQSPPAAGDLRSEIEELRRKIQAMGQVNLYALTELQECEERSKFLAAHHEDLTKAQQSLKDVIAKINRKSRDLFVQTFEAVREQFRDLFRKLFGGGKADILLEEGVDVLEAGIEVIAQPPGRESVKLVALSGGQKAMTTIALLFAIFRAKPSPFCVLDEVDAPLDDANVDRFNLILQEYSQSTQFIVITHNKATMAYASTLYGVTMLEPGVSRQVGIRLEDVDAHLAITPPGATGEAVQSKAA